MFRVILPVAVILFGGLFHTAPARAIEVYFFKGAGDFSFINENMHFSRGLNEMAEKLNSEGIHAEVRRFGAVSDALRIVRKRKPKTIAIIGHSMGALASMSMARSLKGENIRIAYMGLIDIPGPVGVAGENVEWVENYFSITPVYGLLTNASSHPNAKNIHVFGHIHNRMDNAPKVQNGMLAAVRKIHAEEQDGILPETAPENVPEIRSAGLSNDQPAQISTPQREPVLAASKPVQQTQPLPVPAGNSGWSDAERQFVSTPANVPSTVQGVEAYEALAARSQPVYHAGSQAPGAGTDYRYGADRSFVPPMPIDQTTTASVAPQGGNDQQSIIGRVGQWLSQYGSSERPRHSRSGRSPDK